VASALLAKARGPYW